jgi:DNA mismatch repair protein MSH2
VSNHFSHSKNLVQSYYDGCGQKDPIRIVIAASSAHSSSGGAEDLIRQQLLDVLSSQLLASSSPVDNQDNDATAAAAPESPIVQLRSEPLTKKAKNAAAADTRLQSILRQMVEPTEFLRFSADTQFSQYPEIAAGLVVLLETLGWYPTLPPHLFDDNDDDSSIVSNRITRLSHAPLPDCLYMDATAAEALHIWPPPNAAQQIVTGGTSQNNSIYGILASACSTSTGKTLLKHWLQQPLIDIQHIQTRQDAVAALVEQSIARDAIRSEGLRLFASTNLTKLAEQLATYQNQNNHDDDDNNNETDPSNPPHFNTRKALQTLYDLYLVAFQKIPLLTEQLVSGFTDASSSPPPPQLLQSLIEALQTIAQELERSIELAQAVLDLSLAPREFAVQSDYKEELKDIRHELEAIEAELQQCKEDMNETWARVSGGNGNSNAVRLEQESSSTEGGATTSTGWQFRLPNTNDSKILQNQLSDLVRVRKILKNGVYFTTPQLEQLSCQQAALQAEYDRHSRQVVQDAMAVAATYAPVIARASEAVCHLDVLVALAHAAVYSSPHGTYCRPTLTDSEQDGAAIILKAARHPCVELQESIEFIPNDYKLAFGESSFVIVTGPNMGGKSTYIRALGAIVVLAQIGAFVPCESAHINVCHHILARVGAGDMQDRGISTFMAEMLESSSILRTATKRSLIIIDELGRGTSTFDGYGLARAISEYIIQQIGCYTVFATHFHELTVLEELEPSVHNCHVTAQKDEQGQRGLTFLYEVKPGPCLESFGIQVAEMAHVPKVVIQDAKRRARELENFEYRKKIRTTTAQNDEEEEAKGAKMVVDHESSEAASAAISWVNRFRRLHQDILTKQYNSDAEKKQALLQMMTA